MPSVACKGLHFDSQTPIMRLSVNDKVRGRSVATVYRFIVYGINHERRIRSLVVYRLSYVVRRIDSSIQIVYEKGTPHKRLIESFIGGFYRL